MKDKIALIYRIIIVIVTSIALYVNFKFLSLRQGILYFTNISNLLCLIYFLVLVIKTLLGKAKKDSERSEFDHIVKGMVTMAITLTFFMFNFALTNDVTSDVFIGHEIECCLVHVVVPGLVMLDYTIFGAKGYQKKYYPFIWSTILIAYQMFVIVYVAYGGRFINGLKYPYSYMDVSALGIKQVAINMLIVYTIFILYGMTIQKLDDMAGKSKKIK